MDNLETNSEKKYCQKQAIIFNSFNQIITNTIVGDIMVLFLTDVLLFETINITFILSLIPLISIVRLPLIFILMGSNKITMIKTSIIIKIILVITLLLVPWNFLSFWRYTALIIIYQIAVEFGVGICWQPLLREITTAKDRGKFFSNMRFVFMMLNSIYVFLLSVFVGNAMSSQQYRVLLGVSLFGMLLQYYAIKKIGKKQIIKENDNLKRIDKPIKEQIKENRIMVWPLILDLLFLTVGFTLNVVYLKTVLGYSSKLVSLYITLNNLGGTLLLPIIGRVLDRSYKKASNYICGLYLVYLLVLICIPVYTPDHGMQVLLLIMLALLSGVIASSAYLLMTVLQHKLVKSGEDTFIILNLYQIIMYLSTFAVTNIMGVVISKAAGNPLLSTHQVSLDLFKVINTILILICVAAVKIVIKKIISADNVLSSDF